MGHIRLTFHIHAPLEQVAALYRDVARVPDWQYDILEVKDASGPLDRLLFRRAFARTVREYNENFAALAEGRTPPHAPVRDRQPGKP